MRDRPQTTVVIANCALCRPEREAVLWRDARCRVVRVEDRAYPGYCRVVWNAHVRELSDLEEAERRHLMAVVDAVERVLRDIQKPDKINLASFGNQIPHVHWHVIPRFADDAHFPDPIWAPVRRGGRSHPVDGRVLTRALLERLGAGKTGTTDSGRDNDE